MSDKYPDDFDYGYSDYLNEMLTISLKPGVNRRKRPKVIPDRLYNSVGELESACDYFLELLRQTDGDWKNGIKPLFVQSVELLRRAAVVDFGMPEPPTLDWSDDVSVYAALLKIQAFAKQKQITVNQVGRPLPQSQQDICDLLREIGRRMTLAEIEKALDERGLHQANSYLRQKLADLTGKQILNNRSDTRPRGYGFPDWD